MSRVTSAIYRGLALRRALPAVLLAPAVLGSAFLASRPAPARAEQASPASIEGVWSFNGGKVAIQHQADGSFVGIVVAPTRFAECSHPIGEQMWTGMRLQPDGSYWGMHEWFFENAACVLNPQLGPTAWRVLGTTHGGHFLRACFSPPGSSQPTISVAGASTNVGYGCADSALVAPSPGTSGTLGFRSAVSLPSARKCFSRRIFRIHLRDPRNDPLREALVTLGKSHLRVLRHGNKLTSTVDLRGLPKGAFTIRIELRTVLGHRLSGARTYHTCIRPRRAGSHRR